MRGLTQSVLLLLNNKISITLMWILSKFFSLLLPIIVL